MKSSHTPDPALFKGIALFTPGGDVIYCIDTDKQARWHITLCTAFQEALNLPEPPHFLVPCYAATVDRWFDAQTQQVRITAEAAPLVLRYQALLNLIFETVELVWQASSLPEGLCDPIVLTTYRQQFPQLWEPHDLVLRYEQNSAHHRLKQGFETLTNPATAEAQGYVLRLFVSGNQIATERTLLNLHRLLEECMQQPYTLKVIDVLQHPELAEADQIAATPTLVKVYPKPIRRIVGNLDNAEQLQGVLGVLTG